MQKKRAKDVIKSIPVISNLDQDLKKADGRIHQLRLDKLSKAIGTQPAAQANGKAIKTASGSMQSPSGSSKGAFSARKSGSTDRYGRASPVGYGATVGVDQVAIPLVYGGSELPRKRLSRVTATS